VTKRYWSVLGVYLLAQFAFLIFTPIIYFLTPLNRLEATIYGNIIGFILGLMIIFYILRFELRTPVRGAASTSEVILWSILGVFMAYFAQALAVLIEMKIFGITVESENTATLMEMTRIAPLFIIVTTIIAPILEEIVFRKIIFGSLYKRTNFLIAGVLSSLIFAVVHGELIHILIYASMGFVFAYLYVKTKRIIVPIIVHMALNTIAVLGQLSLSPEDIENIRQQLENLQTIFWG